MLVYRFLDLKVNRCFSDHADFVGYILIFNYDFLLNQDLLLQIFIPSTFFLEQLLCCFNLLLQIGCLLSSVPMLNQISVSNRARDWRHVHPLFPLYLQFWTYPGTNLNRFNSFSGDILIISHNRFDHVVNFSNLFRT